MSEAFSIWRWLSLGLLLSLLSACGGGSFMEKRDSAPSTRPDVSQVPDAVPKIEPRSRYGNPDSYVVFGKRYYTMQSSEGYVERGIASWYGTKFHGKRTSSGEPYDMYKMTAAHKTLPLPTYVQVTNLNNGRKVIVKVNDRGPFHENRIIDLSYSAAIKLGIDAKGTGLVEVRAITPGTQQASYQQTNTVPEKSLAPVAMYLQVGAFSQQARAEQIKLELQSKLSQPVMIDPMSRAGTMLYRVRIGPLANVEQGDSLANSLVTMGFNDSHIVVE